MTVLPPVSGDPYTWPYDSQWTVEDTALIIIDMQVLLAVIQSVCMLL